MITLNVSGVLWFRERLCVLRVGDLIQNVLIEAHGLSYSIHLDAP